MPTYTYRCQKCGDEIEAVQSMTDPPLKRCRTCRGKLVRTFHPVGIVLKGSGFYKTDSRSAKRASDQRKESSSGENREAEAGKDSGSSKESGKESSKDSGKESGSSAGSGSSTGDTGKASKD